jgi:hypothetical protein
MPAHEHFRELSALAAIGQISSEEDRELSQHLRECSECYDAHGDYAHVVQHQLPLTDAVRSRKRSDVQCSLPDAELRDRFLARARAEGINFSATAVGPERVDSARVRWGFNWRPTLVIAASAVFAIFGTSLVRRYQLVPRPGLPSGQGIALIEENESLNAQLSALRGISNAMLPILTG